MSRRVQNLGIRAAAIAAVLALLSTAFVGTAHAADPEEPTGAISGAISDSRGVSLHTPRQLRVAVFDSQGSQAGFFGEVAVDGTYTVTGLATGSYRVHIQDWQHSYLYKYFGGSGSLDQATPVAVTDGQITNGIDVALDLSVVLAGTFVGPGGEAIESPMVQVVAYDETGAEVGGARAEDVPSFELGEIPTGRYRLAFYDSFCGYRTEYFNNSDSFVGSRFVDVVRGEIRNLGAIELARSNGICAPDSPTGSPTVTSSGGQLSATWQSGQVEGAPEVTGYVVSSLPAGAGCVTSGAPTCVLTGVTAGVDYRFFVSATNTGGTSLPSPPSAVVRGPAAPVVVTPARDFVGKKQKVTKRPARVSSGRSKSLPARSTAGVKVNWESLTPRKCVVRSGKVYGKSVGKCRLKAVAMAKGSWLRYESVTAVRVR